MRQGMMTRRVIMTNNCYIALLSILIVALSVISVIHSDRIDKRVTAIEDSNRIE